LLTYRGLDDALGLTDMAIRKLLDGHRGENTRHELGGLLRQSVFGRLAGYEDVNDAERLARDPAIRAIVGREGLDRFAADLPELAPHHEPGRSNGTSGEDHSGINMSPGLDRQLAKRVPLDILSHYVDQFRSG